MSRPLDDAERALLNLYRELRGFDSRLIAITAKGRDMVAKIQAHRTAAQP